MFRRFNGQSLETLGELKEIRGYVRMSIDKLQGIMGDLVRTDDNWRVGLSELRGSSQELDREESRRT